MRYIFGVGFQGDYIEKISPDAVEDIGIFAELEDSVNSFYGVGGSLHNFFSKNIVKVKLGKGEISVVRFLAR